MGHHYDVAIVGGGIVGRALAAALRQGACRRLKVALFDAGRAPELQPRTTELGSYSNRVSSITSTNFHFLRSLIETPHALDAHSHGFTRMHVWDRDSPDSLISLSSEHAMGRIVENCAITSAMRVPDVDVYEGSHVALHYEGDHVRIDTPDRQLTCSLVVGADGKSSVVRSLVKPPLIERRYDQKGLVATLRIRGGGANDAAYQRFLRTGPFALLPLDKDVMSMVWTLPSPLADALLGAQLDKTTWLLLLRSALELLSADVEFFARHPIALTPNECKWRRSSCDVRLTSHASTLPQIDDVEMSSLAAFPLQMCIAQRTVSPRAIIIGDAAHVIHPLAGQGVNLGIGDVRSLVAELGRAASLGADLGDPALYRLYEKRRLGATMAMSGFVDSIHRIFDQSFVAPSLRTYGMQLFDRLPALKSLAIRTVMVLGGDSVRW